jgi:hypothetical protein
LLLFVAVDIASAAAAHGHHHTINHTTMDAKRNKMKQKS